MRKDSKTGQTEIAIVKKRDQRKRKVNIIEREGDKEVTNEDNSKENGSCKGGNR